jgi:histidinol dehydrogenase
MCPMCFKIEKVKVYKNISPSVRTNVLKRPVFETKNLNEIVSTILLDIQENGDIAVQKYAAKFDKSHSTPFLVSDDEIKNAIKIVSSELKTAINIAYQNIKRFHQTQITESLPVETMKGVVCYRKSVGIERVGLYIPGGTAPLFSTVLMLGIPAVMAGCKQIVLCTPPASDGTVPPAILYAAHVIGITEIFKIGGVQAIGAMAYGTETVPKVFKIFGPGNQYVTCAKQLVANQGVAIDMPAGPSEVLVLADDTANPDFVASDLLSQAEHGADSQVVLITLSDAFLQKTLQSIESQLKKLPRKAIAQQALANSIAIVAQDYAEAMAISNEYAPEHLILATENAALLAEQVVNAGSVFMGHYSPESVGDYASGTNHTLPTNGFARAAGGVSLDSFVKKITFQSLTQEGLKNISSTVICMAEAEQLQAHAEAVRIRLINT